VGVAGISTLLSSTNFYTALLRLRDKVTNTPVFTVLSVELACAACKESGRSAECIHMLHLIPRSHPVTTLPNPCASELVHVIHVEEQVVPLLFGLVVGSLHHAVVRPLGLEEQHPARDHPLMARMARLARLAHMTRPGGPPHPARD
jgi:hypothetical protein